MKKLYMIYIIVFLAVCMIPSAGLLFGGSEESLENRDTAQAPVLLTETGVNPQFLGDAGAWFEDNFAYRNEWVTGYALLMGKVFGVSSQESVIAGKNGWLYYKDSLADYQGAELMTERQLFNVAHSLAMVQDYAQENGVQFAFAAAPNKNSLYGENMPYYYQSFRSGESNLERIQKYLESEQVNYVDLHKVLGSREEILYHKTDSHWNNKGAALAADAVLSNLGKTHRSYADEAYGIRKDFEGDLENMLYPAAMEKEEELYYDPMPQFTYNEEVESNFAPKIYTNSESDGSLVMYRDSFGNALLPFMAEAYGNAYFSRALPYRLSDLAECEADTLVIERAERFLPDMAARAPYMPAPLVSIKNIGQNAGLDENAVDIDGLEIVETGDYTQVTGRIPMESLADDARIYIRVNGGSYYEAFPVTNEDGQEGFSLLLETKVLTDKKTEAQDADLQLYVCS